MDRTQNACWEILIDHSTTCPMCRNDISNEYGNNTSFAVSIIRDCAISLNYDANLLFGHKGLNEILKKRCDNRSMFVLKIFIEYYLNDRHELIQSIMNRWLNTFLRGLQGCCRMHFVPGRIPSSLGFSMYIIRICDLG